jgi:two-component system, LytTR family, sensor kinase
MGQIGPIFMLQQQQLAALLIKVAVSASIASILMRFARMQRILLRDERTLADRLQLALIFSFIFSGTAVIRLLSHQYGAVDLAMEGSIIAGMLGGYVSALVTGICCSIPDMFAGKLMSMPLYAAAALIGALMHDLAPLPEDIWHFSPFIDLNVYRLLRQILKRDRSAIQRRVVALAAFNVACNFLIVVAELFRWGVHKLFKVHNTFFLFEGSRTSLGVFIVSAAFSLFAVSLPIRIWSSFRVERQLELQRVRLTEARLAALTNQINPHFLFNTLNSVTSLIRIDPDRARYMVLKLSSILRRLLRKTENFSVLRDEISFIDDYLGIEMVRFGEKLRWEKEVDENTLDRLVPSMILQPIIENSIKHGLSNKIDGGTVRMKTWLEQGRLLISIEDDGQGIAEAKMEKIWEQGIGVSNVNERLRVLFGSGYRMLIESTPGQGTRTLLEIPEIDEYSATSGPVQATA